MSLHLVYAHNSAAAKEYADFLRNQKLDGKAKNRAFVRSISAYCGEPEKCDVLVLLDPAPRVAADHLTMAEKLEFDLTVNELFDAETPTTDDLASMKYNDLLAFAKEHNIEVPKDIKKVGPLRAFLMAWQHYNTMSDDEVFVAFADFEGEKPDDISEAMQMREFLIDHQVGGELAK